MLPKLTVKIGADTGELNRGLTSAQDRMAQFARRAAVAGAAFAAATATALLVVTRGAMQTIDSQAKLAQSLGTTVESLQVLARAGELAGVSMSGIEQATKDLTRRLSQAAGGTGPAADALERLGLTADDLAVLPLDERIRAINDAIDAFIPVTERAAVAGQLFGEEGSIAMARLNSATLNDAIQDIDDFGVAVSEIDADKIEAANDAMSRLGLITQGIGNALAVASAGGITTFANAMAAIWTDIRGPVTNALEGLLSLLGRIATIAATAAVILAGAFVGSLIASTIATFSLAGAWGVLNAVIAVSPLGLLAIVVGTVVYEMIRLIGRVGTVGETLQLLGTIGTGVFHKLGAGVTVLKLSMQLAFDDIGDYFEGAMDRINIAWGRMLDNFALSSAGMLGRLMGFELQGGNELAALRGAGSQDEGNAEVRNSTMESLSTARDVMNQPIAGLQDLLDLYRDIDDEGSDLTDTTNLLNTAIAGLPPTLTAAAEALAATTTEMNNQIDSIGKTIEQSLSQGFMSIISGTQSTSDAFKEMARKIIEQLYEILVVQQIVGQYTPGVDGAAGTGTGLVGTIMNVGSSLLGFEGGGYTGGGSRSGGVDGRGGFAAILHPQETVIDHTRGQSSGGSGITVNQTINVTTGVQQTVRAEMMTLLPRIVEASKAGVMDARKRGGSFAAAF
jgi:hypothetical protein